MNGLFNPFGGEAETTEKEELSDEENSSDIKISSNGINIQDGNEKVIINKNQIKISDGTDSLNINISGN